MGGASSHDIRDGILEPDNPDYERKLRQLNAAGALYRVNHRSWWKEELPGEDEYRTAREALDKTGWDVDYIITHCCPSSIQDTFSGGLFQRDALTDFLDEVRERCRFQYWFFGHYHENMVVEKEFVMLYNQIMNDPTQFEQVDETCGSGRVVLHLKSLGMTVFFEDIITKRI